MTESPKSLAVIVFRPRWWERPRLTRAALIVILSTVLAAYGWSQTATAPSLRPVPSQATKDKPWTNSLGMVFVPVPKTKVLFCIWETRVQDFEAFVQDQTNNGGYPYQKGNEPYILKSDGWKQRGWDYAWNHPGFVQRATHPVTCVSWQDAQAFCQWLTQKEQRGAKLQKDQSYRLPTDAEWSMAVGLNEPDGGTLRDKDGKNENVYPWGRQWPPPDRAGNFAGEESMGGDNPPGYWIVIPGYGDGFARTAPVGSFKANELGIFDLGGNVWEWCVDWYEDESGVRVLRGGSCYDGTPKSLLSSSRFGHKPNLRGNNFGFRVVLVGGAVP